ncbi:hypothetical protein [Aureivirga sp. CE67]|uniref:hypothetical protein n=1 Tax=Aureivirga sp. CE67 TaxID=1788983 RepID=UPI0018CA39FA|nr:hypothetical protein [Aureivirga sp. CE67]
MKLKLFFVSIFMLFSILGFSQIKATLVKEIPLDADSFVGVDTFENFYFVKDNILYKKTDSNLLSYANISLGNISSVDITDPTKIIIFYKDFSSFDILNRNLIKIETIELLDLNMTFIRKSTDSNVWIYSDVFQKVFLYDYRMKRIILESEFIRNNEIKEMTSNYNFCWLLTEKNSIIELNLQLNMTNIEKDLEIEKIETNSNDLILKTEDSFYKLFSDKSLKKINLSAKEIKDFYSNENYLYIFERKQIKVFEISKND